MQIERVLFLVSLFIFPGLVFGRGLSSDDEKIFRLRSAFSGSAASPFTAEVLSTDQIQKKYVCVRRSNEKGSGDEKPREFIFSERRGHKHVYENLAPGDFRKFAFGGAVGSRVSEVVGVKDKNASEQIHDVLFVRQNATTQNLTGPGLIIEEARIPKTVELNDANKKSFAADGQNHEESVSHLRGLSLAYLHCPNDKIEWSFPSVSSGSSFVAASSVTLKDKLVTFRAPKGFKIGAAEFSERSLVIMDLSRGVVLSGELAAAGDVNGFALRAGRFSFAPNGGLISATLAQKRVINEIAFPAVSTLSLDTTGKLKSAHVLSPVKIHEFEFIGWLYFDSIGRLESGTLASDQTTKGFQLYANTHLTLSAGRIKRILATDPREIRIGNFIFVPTKKPIDIGADDLPTGAGTVRLAAEGYFNPLIRFPAGAEIEYKLSGEIVSAKFVGTAHFHGWPVDGHGGVIPFKNNRPSGTTSAFLTAPLKKDHVDLPAGTKIVYGPGFEIVAVEVPSAGNAIVNGIHFSNGQTVILSPNNGFMGLIAKDTLLNKVNYRQGTLVRFSEGFVFEGTLAEKSRVQIRFQTYELAPGSRVVYHTDKRLAEIETSTPIEIQGASYRGKIKFDEDINVLSATAGKDLRVRDGVLTVKAGSEIEFLSEKLRIRPFEKKVFYGEMEFESEWLTYNSRLITPNEALRLSKDFKRGPYEFKAGTIFKFDGLSFSIRCLQENCDLAGIKFRKDAEVFFAPTYELLSGTLAEDQKIGPCKYRKDSSIQFHKRGVGLIVKEGRLAEECSIATKKVNGEIVVRNDTVVSFHENGVPRVVTLSKPYFEWAANNQYYRWNPLPQETDDRKEIRWAQPPISLELGKNGYVLRGFISQNLETNSADGSFVPLKEKVAVAIIADRKTTCVVRNESLLVFRDSAEVANSDDRFNDKNLVRVVGCDVDTFPKGDQTSFVYGRKNILLKDFFARSANQLDVHAYYFAPGDRIFDVALRAYAGIPFLKTYHMKCGVNHSHLLERGWAQYLVPDNQLCK